MSDNYDDERIKKQLYLREEIIDQGYEPSTFKDFMENQKDDGCNIDNWTFSELKKMVSIFKTKYANNDFEKINDPEILIKEQKKTEEAGKNYGSIENIGEEEKMDQSKTKLTETLFVKALEKEDDDFIIDYPVKKLKLDIERVDNLEISITRTENQKGGFFGLGRNHIVFVIKTNPYNWEVKRRFRDFLWLRDVLAGLYPGYLIPAMTKKKPGKADDEFYNKKKQIYLNMFLKLLSQTPELFYNDFTISFLKITDEKKFNSKKKEGETIKKTSKIQEVSNIDGQINIKSGKENKVFCHYLGEYLSSVEPIYLNMKKMSKKLLINIDDLTTTLFDFGNNFDALFKLTNDANAKLYSGNLSPLKDVYVSVNNMMNAWGNSLVKQANFMQEHFHEFLKFQHKQISDISKWETINLPAGITEKELLQNKKQAFKYMCLKDNNIEKDLQIMYGYLNTQSYNEITNGIKRKADQYNENFRKITEETIQIMKDFMQDWGQTMGVNINLFEEKKIVLNRESSMATEKIQYRSSIIRPPNPCGDSKADSESD